METKNRIAFDYDDEKAKLVKKSASLENDIEENIQKIKEYVEENGKNALIIGGSLLATYLVLRLLTSSEEKTVQVPPQNYQPSPAQPVVHVVKNEEDSAIVKQIKSSIALFLVSIAKKKLQDFIESFEKEKTKEE
jgi:hypothetical protein